MNVKNLFHFLLIIFCTSGGCSSAGKPEAGQTGIEISLSRDSTSVELHHISRDILQSFQTDSLDEDQWQDFFAVYIEPADATLRDIQKPLKGTYHVSGSLISFTPAVAFKKGQTYYAQCYAKKLLIEPTDIIISRKLPSETAPVEKTFSF